MYSVIVPTMWKGKELATMLPLIDAHSLVGEIIIIDNDKINIPQWLVEGRWTKIKVYQQDNNIYVNPAWNLGVQEAKFEHCCILSDDIEFDIRVLDLLHDKLGPNDGCVGLAGNLFPENYGDDYVKADLTKPIELVEYPYDRKMECGYGVLMFFNKANYVPIPFPLRVFFGDCWIFEIHRTRNRKPRKLVNLAIKTKFNTTSGAFNQFMVWEKMFLANMFEYIYRYPQQERLEEWKAAQQNNSEIIHDNS